MLYSNELTSLLEDFYTLTGIRIVLFDESYRELCSFPSGEDTLCSCLRENPEFDRKCRECDQRFFAAGKSKTDVQVYRCHAGLIEASVPIFRNRRIMGYLMFGQITDEKDKYKFLLEMKDICQKYGFNDISENKILKVKYKNERQIPAAAKILEAVAGYAILKDMVHGSKPMIEKIERYIDEHLGEELNVDILCRQFGISRTGLYQLMKPYCVGGVSEAIKQKRLLKAKELIETTTLSISEISERVGFNDYNYFLRCFKAKYGRSSNHYRR